MKDELEVLGIQTVLNAFSHLELALHSESISPSC